MKATRERLKQGAALFQKQFKAETASKQKQAPRIDYPAKEVRKYVYNVTPMYGNKACVSVLERTFYKTVEGYRQVNYERYRILSEPKWKDKYVDITISTVPSALNDLNKNYVQVIKDNALGIISFIVDPSSCPDWAMKVYLEEIHKDVVKSNKVSADIRTNENDRKIKEAQKTKDFLKRSIDLKIKNETDINKKIDLCVNRASKAGFYEHKLLVSVLSFGLYNPYLIYKRSIQRAHKYQLNLSTISYQKNNLITKHINAEIDLNKLLNERLKIDNDILFQKELEKAQYEYDMSNAHCPMYETSVPKGPIKKISEPIVLKHEYSIDSLKASNIDESLFVDINSESLKKYQGLSMIGVCVIRNKMSGSAYIGVSFDIFKSIIDLFNDNIPTNFYMKKEYESDKKKNNNLFDVSITFVSSLDELSNKFSCLRKLYNARFIKL